MAAEFDTQPDYTSDDDPAREPAPKNERGMWGALALAMLAGLALFVLLTQFTARVPNTVGLSRLKAESTLAKAGFAVGDVSEIPGGSGTPGSVQEQVPVAGTTVRKGTTVDLVTSLRADLVRVPDVLGHDSASASVQLLQAGFRVDNAEEFSDAVPVGAAVSQSPPAGALVTDGSTITVAYSIGPQPASRAVLSRSSFGPSASGASDGTVGSGAAPLIMNCTRAYPGASAWSYRGDIYVRLTSGASARRVTSTGDWDTEPVVSPSHEYVVFLRASGSGAPATAVGAVCLTTFDTHMIPLPETTANRNATYSYSRPVFAPGEHSTTPDSDWIVVPQYWTETRGDEPAASARLLVCNVPMGSSWVSWNLQFRPAQNLSLGASRRAGCVRVTQKSGSSTVFSSDFNATTGLYLR